MSTDPSDIAVADDSGRQRARLALIAPIFLLQQAAFGAGDGGDRAIDMVRLGCWLFMVAAMAALLLTGGYWLRTPAVRALMNDETARDHRARGMSTGFCCMIATAVVLYLVEALRPGAVTTAQALHMVVSLGLAAALIRFGMLERRALG
jgi:hypothetical protein